MRTLTFGILGALMFFGTIPAMALETATINVKCSSKTKLQSSIDKAKAGSVTTIWVTGTCMANLEIPHGKTIILAGQSGATIRAANGSEPVVRSLGNTTIESMNIDNPAGTAYTLVTAQTGGYLRIAGSKLDAPNTEYMATFDGGSAGTIVNSRLTGGTTGSIDMWERAFVRIDGRPDDIPGPDQYTTTITSSREARDGLIGCGLGSALTIVVKTSGNQNGAVLLKDSHSGLQLGVQCAAYLNNKTGNPDNLMISGMSQFGIRANHSTLSLKAVSIKNNGGSGLDALLSQVDIGSSSFSGNGSADIISGVGNSVMINNWDGTTAMPDAFDSDELWCWPRDSTDTEANTGRITILDGALEIPAGKSLDTLRNLSGCAYVE
jgi:hypothetical protein